MISTFQIVIVFEGGMPTSNLSKTLKYLIKSHTYLEWKKGEEDMFWTRLKTALLNARSKHEAV